MDITGVYAIFWLLLTLHTLRRRWQPTVHDWFMKARKQPDAANAEQKKEQELMEKSQMIDNFGVFSPAFMYALFVTLMLVMELIDIIGLLLTQAIVSGTIMTWIVHLIMAVYAVHFLRRLWFTFRMRKIMGTHHSPFTVMSRHSIIFEKHDIVADIKNVGLLVAGFYLLVQVIAA